MWWAVAPSHQSSSFFKELGTLELGPDPPTKPGHRVQGPIPAESQDIALFVSPPEHPWSQCQPQPIPTSSSQIQERIVETCHDTTG